MTDHPDYTPEEALTEDLGQLIHAWADLGIDLEDFCRCAKCHRFFADFAEADEESCTCGSDTTPVDFA